MPDTDSQPYPRFDVVVVGSGAAGLTLALRLAHSGQRIAVISKGALAEGSTLYAQGGISAVLDADDSVEAHVADTLAAGAGLCDEAAVRHTVSHSREAIEWLIDRGVPFTRADGNEGDAGYAYHLNREGGHSHRRIIHAEDATGRAVETTLEGLTRKTPEITVFEHHMAVELIMMADDDEPRGRCRGVYVLDIKADVVRTFAADRVVLATGGANLVYLYSSNPHAASGDGIAMAWRAGARVANMEFMQFHPTCLFHPQARSFLISEALRGEGAVLRLADGSRFMPRHDARAELAPRDVVARAIDAEMKRTGQPHVWLDITHHDKAFIEKHFPGINQRCLELGLDMSRDPLPVVPAAHYTCGGVITDLAGRTDIAGVYAVGECAFTGLHGANRMASNSLLECIVYASAAAADIATRDETLEPLALPSWDESRVTDSDEEVIVAHNWQELRRFMWDYVGIVRTTKRLERALHRIELLRREIHDYYGSFRVTPGLLELRNLAQLAELIIRSALDRRESRGLHFIRDYPHTLPRAMHTVLSPEPKRTANGGFGVSYRPL
ncbi:L-aspartate oxidase [Endozoicomonas sp. G2_2]|uniref:L-aspartate oxidase n=1 Tax=Endozoicomonas sp. G2_2 TaxID=2821092 RepID=UPI001ADB4BD3|nr:L-aspartate oxidase [Endozoicomonas sp. G2_2]MBO9471573.1 L-aspartate oxidase [Endozoicomonas sp. G2_2]